jgi:hypothetical protein
MFALCKLLGVFHIKSIDIQGYNDFEFVSNMSLSEKIEQSADKQSMSEANATTAII